MSERDIQRLLALVEAHLGKAWIEAVEWLRGLPANAVDQIEERLRRHDYAGLVRDIDAMAKQFSAEMQHGYITAGREASAWLDGEVGDKLIRFDVTNARAVSFARNNEYRLIEQLQQDQRDMIRGVISDGTAAGINPREMARSIRDGIGLTSSQEQIVRNYRDALNNGDWSDALGRELRDGRSDRTLRKLRDSGGSLSSSQVDAMVEKYRANFVAYRAETIARTEGARNVHQGANDAMRQAIERGDVKADQLIQEWVPGPRTKNARRQHQQMRGQQRPFGQAFVAPDGTRLQYPGDPSAPPEQTANCRCSVATRLGA